MTKVKLDNQMIELSDGNFISPTKCDRCENVFLDVIYNKPEEQPPMSLCDQCMG